MNKTQLHKFIEVLNDNNDLFFSTGDIKTDCKIVENTIDAQGYWSGLVTKYYFDDDYNLINTEIRQFGSRL